MVELDEEQQLADTRRSVCSCCGRAGAVELCRACERSGFAALTLFHVEQPDPSTAAA